MPTIRVDSNFAHPNDYSNDRKSASSKGMHPTINSLRCDFAVYIIPESIATRF